MPLLLQLLLIGAIVAVAARLLVRRVVVFQFERGLKYVDGRFRGVLGAGTYWFTVLNTVIRKVDIRPKFVSISGQEVLSADGVTLKVSLAARYRIVDPAIAVNQIEDFQQALYLELQMGIREIIGGAAIDDLLANRSEFGARLLERKKSVALELGLSLESVDVKDVMFPGELKRIFSQVVKARKEGQAALEKARAETATLRHLANAASLIDRHPSILQLRLLQTAQESSGNTLVLGMPPQTTPLPVRDQRVEPDPKADAPPEKD